MVILALDHDKVKKMKITTIVDDSCTFEVLRNTRQNSEFLARLARLQDFKNFQLFLLYLSFQLEIVVKKLLQNYFMFESSKFF